MGKVDIQKLTVKVSNMPKVLALARAEAERRVENSKEQFLSDFNNHPVTKEIDGGIDSSNGSGTLGGAVGANGKEINLFMFIGFNKESAPASIVWQLINEYRVNKNPTNKRVSTNIIRYTFKVNGPDKGEFEKATPMPDNWQDRSCLFAVEQGISGLQYTITATNSDNSRSGAALQASEVIRSVRYRPVPYFSKLLSDFYKRL